MIGLSDLDKYLTLNVSFPVPFDIVWQLLGYSQKSHAKDRLKKKLTLGVHYCYEDMALYKKKANPNFFYQENSKQREYISLSIDGLRLFVSVCQPHSSNAYILSDYIDNFDFAKTGELSVENDDSYRQEIREVKVQLKSYVEFNVAEQKKLINVLIDKINAIESRLIRYDKKIASFDKLAEFEAVSEALKKKGSTKINL